MITEAVGTARATGCSGTLIVRMDSAFYGAPAVSAARQAGAYFSVTVRMDPKIRAAIAGIAEDAWTPIRYPRAVWDGQLGRWVSDAEVAEVPYTAFTSRKRGQAGHRPADRPPRQRPQQEKRPLARASCSAPGATTPSSPTPRSSLLQAAEQSAAVKTHSPSASNQHSLVTGPKAATPIHAVDRGLDTLHQVV